MFTIEGDYQTLKIVDFGLATETSNEKYIYKTNLDLCFLNVVHQVT